MIVDIEDDIMNPVMQCTTLPRHSGGSLAPSLRLLKPKMHKFESRVQRRDQIIKSHLGHLWSKLLLLEYLNVHSCNKESYAVILRFLPEHPSDTGNKSYHLYKEYVVDVTSANVGKLVVGLLPWDNSIAFVNGIEVLSVPDKLFSVKVTPIPLGDGFDLPGRVGFETVYRVDMGGSGLLPKDDPFWRKWDSDEEFLVNPAAARNVSVDPGLIRYHDGVASDVISLVGSYMIWCLMFINNQFDGKLAVNLDSSNTKKLSFLSQAMVAESGEGSRVHWWRRVEKVVVGRRRYGGVMVVEEIEWKMKKRLS
ncbi:receptor-like protein kinase THESEUS 1 [Tanacetum coccineum]